MRPVAKRFLFTICGPLLLGGLGVEVIADFLPDVAQPDKVRQLEVDLGRDAGPPLSVMLEGGGENIVLVKHQVQEISWVLLQDWVIEIMDRKTNVDHVGDLLE